MTSVRPCVVAPSRQLSTSLPFLDRYFTKKHEWVNVEGTKGTVGVSAYAADALGDIVYVQLPDPGTELAAGEVSKVCMAYNELSAAVIIRSAVCWSP